MTTQETTPADNKAKISFFRSMQMVTWAFFGLRSKAGSKDDMSRTNPYSIVAAGLIGAALFVFTCILVVKLVLGSQ